MVSVIFCPKTGVSPPPTNRGPKHHMFSRISQLNRNLPGYIFRMKHDVHKREVRYKLQGVSYIVSKRHELWFTNGFKLEVSFHPPSVNSAFRFIARLRRRRPANGTQPNYAKRCSVIRANNMPYREVAVIPAVKSGTQKLWHLIVFSQLRDLMANFCWMKRDVDNWVRVLESTNGLRRCLKTSWTLIHKRLKTGPEFLPILTIVFRPSPSHTSIRH